MPTPRQSTGRMGEDLAAAFLVSKGYRILERGVHAGKMGELDIIALCKDTLVFVEVKTRRSLRYGSPEESVTATKLKKLQRAGEWYRKARRFSDLPYRLDVIAIELGDGEPVIRHHEAVEIE